MLKRRTLLIAGAAGLAAAGTTGALMLANRPAPTRSAAWSVPLPGGKDANLCVRSMTCYVLGPGDTATAINVTDGTPAWTYPLEGTRSGVQTEIDADSSTCYFHDRDPGLTAIDVQSGKKRWSRGSTSLKVAYEGAVYCSSTEFLVAVDFATAADIWKFPLNDRERVRDAIATVAYLHVRSDARLLTLDRRTGALLWQQPHSTPPVSWAASEGGLIIGTNGTSTGQITRLDQKTGATMWSRPVTSPGEVAVSASNIACDDKTLILVGSSGHQAMSLATGADLWQVKKPESDPEQWLNHMFIPFAINRDTMFVAESSHSTAKPNRIRVSAWSISDGAALWIGDIPGEERFDSRRVRLGVDGDARGTLYALVAPGNSDTGPVMLHAFRLRS